MASLISAQNTFAVLAALFAIALLSFWAEQQSWGKTLTGAVWAILSAIALSNLHIIPQSSPSYDMVFTYFVPMLLPLFLMHANIKQILTESGRVGIAFILASLGTLAGVVIAASLFNLGEHENILAGMFAATYTGGSANFAAVAQSTGFHDANAIAAATAVDNLLGISFLILLMLTPAIQWLSHYFIERSYSANDSPVIEQHEKHITAISLTAALTFSLSVVAISDMVMNLLHSFFNADLMSLRYLFITLFSVLPATLMPKQMQKMHGGRTTGQILALVFFATIASGANISALLAYAPILFVFVLVVLSVHGMVVLGGGALLTALFRRFGKSSQLGLSVPELIIASNAAILGATTAPALAMARGWQTLVTPGILVGVAGYIIGTPLGLFIAAWW